MKTLSVEFRRQLERTVIEARSLAQAGARVALEALAVQHHEPYGHMKSDQRTLRRRLRAHARQLGDRLDLRSGGHSIDHLVHACAYEHWHGMLFARFLSENSLLFEPDMGIAISLDECEDLARAKEESVDKWALAARFAHRMLPQVFRPDHPVFEVQFAREHRLKLENLVEGLPNEVFTATDSLGWVYQFWQSKKKDEVNLSEVKIGADELSAVTQLFTEPYMVQFLFHNSLGAWWVSRHPKKPCPVDLTYLRKTKEGHPAAGSFEAWPDNLSAFRLLDPCCGSGHFLVAALLMLVPIRKTVEGLTARAAVDAVLRENLHGLELDPRCVELAAFALALAAWSYPGAEGYRPLPELNLACCGLAPNATKEQWISLAEQAAAAAGMPAERDLFGVDDSLLSEPLRKSLGALYDLFEEAPERGSLINPRALKADLFQRDYEFVRELFAAALEHERSTDERAERAVTAQGMARAAELLAGRYHLVITNVPYLARGKQSETLRAFCEQYYSAAKTNLATVFLERCLELCAEGGTTSLVLPQNWLSLKSYEKLREKLLKAETWHLLARLGPKAFQTPMWDFNVMLLYVSRGKPTGHPGGLFGEVKTAHTMYGLDVSESRTASEKAVRLREAEVKGVEQVRQLENPDVSIAFEAFATVRLEQHASFSNGLQTGDLVRFERKFWGIHRVDSDYRYFQSTVEQISEYSGREHVLYWRGEDWLIHESPSAVVRGRQAWAKKGIAVSAMGDLFCTVYTGDLYDDNTVVLIPDRESDLVTVWAHVSSAIYRDEVRKLTQALKVRRHLIHVPFDLDRWTDVARERYPNGLPRPYSDDPTQWIFHGHPCGSVVWDEVGKWTAHGPIRTDDTVLQVAVARLLGYRWPAEQDTQMELADEQREWVRRCETLHAFADNDGIVCIPSIRGEPAAGERLLPVLAAAFGDDWNDGVLTRLLAAAGSPSLDEWLRDRFFDQHCKLFHHRPFVWHIWDGRRRDGFHALVNYHKLAEGDSNGRRCLESLTYSYLGDWIARQQDGVKRGEGGAEDRLGAALELQKRLVAILEGEPPFDLFVRWKSIDQQPVGWEPDINDGVRLNIRPFMVQDIPDGKRGAGILRTKPNIHWPKDRGKEPFAEQERFPWFWNNGEFTGERVNNVHLTNTDKHAARNRAENQS